MNLFVGCSSRGTYNQAYIELAKDVGNFIASENHTLVFGGCQNGLMGVVYKEVIKNNGNIIVTSCKAYEDEVKDMKCTELHLYDTVCKRKDGFIEHSDAFIFLPGGIGTIDEILATIEAKRAQEHRKPIIIINKNHIFDYLLQQINIICGEGFASAESRRLYQVYDSFEPAMAFIKHLVIH